MSTTMTDLAGLDGDRVTMPASSSTNWTRGSRGGCSGTGDDGWDEALLRLERDGREDACARPPARARLTTSPPRWASPASNGLLHRHQGRRPQHRRDRPSPKDGLVLDMSRMSRVIVDPDAEARPRRARLPAPGRRPRDAGARPRDACSASSRRSGVAGLTLGGGLGYLARRFGWTVDNLQEVEIVTADGAIRTAQATRTRSSSGRSAAAAGISDVVTRFTSAARGRPTRCTAA